MRSTAVACAVIVAAGLAGCGSTSHPPAQSAAAVTRALTHAGWQAKQVTGMPDTLTGAPQRFFLQTVAPDGEQLNLQFFATTHQAVVESEAARRRLKVSNLTTVGDAFVRAVGSSALQPSNVSALRRLLPS